MPAQLSPTLPGKLLAAPSSWSRLWGPVHAMVSRFIPLGSASESRPSKPVHSLSVPAYLRTAAGPHRPQGWMGGHGAAPTASSDGLCALGGLRPYRQAPVRVIRMSEQGVRRGQAGRMVISGRMADVCAELDRLAEREATVH